MKKKYSELIKNPFIYKEGASQEGGEIARIEEPDFQSPRRNNDEGINKDSNSFTQYGAPPHLYPYIVHVPVPVYVDHSASNNPGVVFPQTSSSFEHGASSSVGQSSFTIHPPLYRYPYPYLSQHPHLLHAYPINYHPSSHLPYNYGIPTVSGDMSLMDDHRLEGDKVIVHSSSMNSNKSDDTKEKARKYEIRQKEADIKHKIKLIKEKKIQDRTEEEVKLYEAYEERRRRKNERSRERTKEIKAEMDRILDIPEKNRSAVEREWLHRHMKAKKRKNESDRQRRKRIKTIGSFPPGRFSPQHCVDPSSTYSTLDSISNHNNSTENDEEICPQMLMDFVNSFGDLEESPVRGINKNTKKTISPSSTKISCVTGLHVSDQFGSGDLSPLRLPTNHQTQSRSSIFRLKPTSFDSTRKTKHYR